MLSVSILAAAAPAGMLIPLYILFAILGILAIIAVIYTAITVITRKGSGLIIVCLWLATIITLVCAMMCLSRFADLNAPPTVPTEPSYNYVDPQPTDASTTVPTTEETEPPTEPTPTLNPVHTADSDPANWKVKWEIMVDGAIVDNYQAENPLSFGTEQEYFAQEGIPSFRGSNYRQGASYGIATISEEKLSNTWNKGVGSIGKWGGTGWTGQPLAVRWNEEAMKNMGIYESKKQKEGLVEVIQTSMDGHIYFFDADDGSYTRDPINLGMVIKGTASLDPRGWPIMYVGSGINGATAPKMYVVSLLENKVLYSKVGTDNFSKRAWYAFDSSPMVCAATDTLIWPGESGVLYSLKLNTQYDPEAGTLSVDPEIVVKTRYSSSLGRTVGYEASIVIVDHYGFVGDNGGLFFCIDLNTMGLIWARDIGDDLNATPVFQWEDGNGYLYLGTSMEYGQGTARIYKVNANNGDFVWKREFKNIPYDKNVSGGVLSSPLLGKAGTELEGQIIFSISKTPNAVKGLLVALDTTTGESVWEKSLDRYCWSSPVVFYTADNKAYIALGDSGGTISLMNAKGDVLHTVNIGANIEASPVVFENYLVVGTRASKISGVKVS